MFQFLFIFGPASITYLLIHRIFNKDTVPYLNGLIELVCYAALNAVITTVALLPFERVEIVLMPNGIKNIQYGGSAFVFSMIVAVITGVVMSIIKKHIDVSIEIELQKKERSRESEKDA